MNQLIFPDHVWLGVVTNSIFPLRGSTTFANESGRGCKEDWTNNETKT